MHPLLLAQQVPNEPKVTDWLPIVTAAAVVMVAGFQGWLAWKIARRPHERLNSLVDVLKGWPKGDDDTDHPGKDVAIHAFDRALADLRAKEGMRLPVDAPPLDRALEKGAIALRRLRWILPLTLATIFGTVAAVTWRATRYGQDSPTWAWIFSWSWVAATVCLGGLLVFNFRRQTQAEEAELSIRRATAEGLLKDAREMRARVLKEARELTTTLEASVEGPDEAQQVGRSASGEREPKEGAESENRNRT